MFIQTDRSMCICPFYVVSIIQGSESFRIIVALVCKTEESGISVFSLFSGATMILLKMFLKSELLFPF